MSNESKNVDFETVRAHELGEIAKRRREANVAAAKDENGHSKSAAEDLVGLALSGGGVRSASFNLGLLQSLYQKGVLRHVDYLSTVSGGGYVGSSLSSLALHPDTEFDWKNGDSEQETSSDEDQKADPCPLSPSEDGRQPPRVLELIHGGGYLRRPLIFLNRYLVGVLLTNVVALSFVLALAALAACLFRSLDHTWMINWLFALGFQGDIARAFFPTVMFFVLWLVMWGISYWRSGSDAEGRVARWFMTLTIVSSLLACAALLGTGDVSLTHLRDNYGVEPPTELVRSLGGELKTYFFIALLIALIPYLRIKDLIRSGTRPRSAVEGWVFGVASRALLYGIPLVIFGALARENISHFNENRVAVRHGQSLNVQSDFVPLEFRDWSKMWHEIELQATGLGESGMDGQFAVSRRMWESVDHTEVVASRDVVEDISEFDREATMFKRWLMLFGYVVTRQPNSVTDQFDRREEYLQLRWGVCNDLTRSILVDPAFYKEFESIEKDLDVVLANMSDKQKEARAEQIKALRFEAQSLEMKAKRLGTTVEKKVEVATTTEDGDVALTFAEWVASRDEVLKKLDENAANGGTANVAGLERELAELMRQDDGDYVRLENDIKALNWQLLQNYWGDRLSPKSTVYAMVCLDADQQRRWNWFLWSLGFFLLSACIVNMNATSLHGFYRNMLAKMWITECPGIGRRIPLARLETVARGAPYHLIASTVHMLGRHDRKDRARTDTFIFSQSYCGSNHTGYAPTEHYMRGRLDLANAMALSGAALSPTQVRNPLLAVLLMLTNSRLGQWLPNPGHHVVLPGWLDRIVSWFPPVPLRLMVGAVQTAEQRNYCFISDGGHHENLGLESLLLRRCRLIIASDVSGDPQFEFRSFVRVLRRMRFEHGIRIVGLNGRNSGVPLDKLTPESILGLRAKNKPASDKPASDAIDSYLAESHYFVARILYPDDGPRESPDEGFLVYIKPNFTGDEAVDLTRYRLEDPAFPHDPTTDQFYDPQKFESYRQLGFHIGNTVCHDQFYDYQAHSPAPISRWMPRDVGCTEGPAPLPTRRQSDKAKDHLNSERKQRKQAPR